MIQLQYKVFCYGVLCYAMLWYSMVWFILIAGNPNTKSKFCF